LLFYNALLKTVSSENNLGKSSGASFSFGYLGGILVLLIAIKLFIDTENPILGLKKENYENVRAVSFFVSLWFLLFSIPLLVSTKKTFLQNNKNEINLFSQIKKLVWNKGLKKIGIFLIARMLYVDGLNAIIIMGGIFAVGVFQLSVKELLQLSIFMNISALVGAIIGGYFNDLLGSKKVIIVSLLGLVISSILILFSFSKVYFLIFATVNGLFIGPIQSASRVVVSKILSVEDQSKGFGLFATSGKLTSFLGPVLVSTLTFVSGSQRIGFSAAIFLLIAGLILLLRIKNLD
jgi:UMF1 family MFS transporter